MTLAPNRGVSVHIKEVICEFSVIEKQRVHEQLHDERVNLHEHPGGRFFSYLLCLWILFWIMIPFGSHSVALYVLKV